MFFGRVPVMSELLDIQATRGKEIRNRKSKQMRGHGLKLYAHRLLKKNGANLLFEGCGNLLSGGFQIEEGQVEKNVPGTTSVKTERGQTLQKKAMKRKRKEGKGERVGKGGRRKAGGKRQKGKENLRRGQEEGGKGKEDKSKEKEGIVEREGEGEGEGGRREARREARGFT